jgi:hypothetical protein
MNTTEEKLRSILVATGISKAEYATLWDSFFVFDPINFAKQLHRTAVITDSVKATLLALKISMPPAEVKAQREAVVSQAIEAAFGDFWNRLATEKAHA